MKIRLHTILTAGLTGLACSLPAQVIWENDFDTGTIGSLTGSGANQFGDVNQGDATPDPTTISLTGGLLEIDRTAGDAANATILPSNFASGTDISSNPFSIAFDVNTTSYTSAGNVGFLLNPYTGTHNARIDFRIEQNNGDPATIISPNGIGQNSNKTVGPISFFAAYNPTGSAITYTGPDSNSYSLGALKFDAWAGATRFMSDGIMSANTNSSRIDISSPGFGTASGVQTIDNVSINVIPEPSTLWLLGLAGLAVLFFRRR